ncbi:glycoside hydrolase [Amycolatopsis minnesotensis]|uniref:Glycosyl hydrolase family 101 n=1 Tax=Amycolatopsis minnesotensis TaxID=337894 RepID=A0ABN2R765_9PSEU
MKARLRKALAPVAALTLVTTGSAYGAGQDTHVVTVPIAGGQATVDTRTLGVTGRTGDGRLMTLSDPAKEPLGTPGEVTTRGSVTSWSYPDRGIEVEVSAKDGRLVVNLRGTTGTALTWPVTGADPATTAMQVPRGEGLNIPVGDPFWNSPDGGLTDADGTDLKDLTMPFWGTSTESGGASYLVPTDLGTTLRFVSAGRRLSAVARHEFTAARDTGTYTVLLSLTTGAPTAAAQDYRRLLGEQGTLSSLARKIRDNPEVGKLNGAFHAYLWGDGRSARAIEKLRALGISRMWFGYDADGKPLDRDATSAAIGAGYLVGPYDSWDNAQPPDQADTPVANWPAPVWPDACVHDEHGKPVTGFKGRGCYVSSEALARAEPTRHYLEKRVDAMTATGPNSYFLDVDATGELFDDYTAAHPMTQATDRENRLRRMAALSGGRKLVLGSETAGGWANEVISYSHGSSTPVAPGLWAAERDAKSWGGYWPSERPGFFFTPAELPANVAKAMFDPAYRVPLYQTALHDAVVSTDRWELPLHKLPRQENTRILLAMLYNTPLNFALDGKAITEHGARIARLQEFFAVLQQNAGTRPMTGFRWLTGDHLVQETRFGALTVTANFGSAPHDGLPGGCVQASTAGQDGTHLLCPNDLR